MFFGRKKSTMPVPEGKVPVLHASICTGETAAGFKDKRTGHFEEVMLIRSDEDLRRFMKQYGLKEVPPREY